MTKEPPTPPEGFLAGQADERDVLRLQAQDALGRRIVLQPLQTPEPDLLGRLLDRGGYLLVQYRDRTSGYFWDLDTLRRLLQAARDGLTDVSLYDDGRITRES